MWAVSDVRVGTSAVKCSCVCTINIVQVVLNKKIEQIPLSIREIFWVFFHGLSMSFTCKAMKLGL